MTAETVVVVGASPKPQRYSNKAVRSLRSHGHHVIPVHPAVDQIDGLPVKHSLAEIDVPVDTVTLYVGPERGESLAEALLGLRPRRVIFNPGTESERLQGTLSQGGIECVRDCTLLMLDGARF
jgi:predicted CoA-binding protein